MLNITKTKLVVTSQDGFELEEPSIWNEEKVNHHLHLGDQVDGLIWHTGDIEDKDYVYVKIPNTCKIVALTIGEIKDFFTFQFLDEGEKEC